MAYDPTNEVAPTIKVEVEQHHIDNAIPSSGSYCMISEAIKTSLPGATRVQTDLQTIRFTWSKRRCVYLTPRKCQIRLIQFDQGIKPEPYSFTLKRGQVTAPSAAHLKNEAKKRSGDYKSRLQINDGVIKRTGGKAPPRSFVGSRRIFGLMRITKACLHEGPTLSDELNDPSE